MHLLESIHVILFAAERGFFLERRQVTQQATEGGGLASEETGQFLVLRENKVYFIGCIERAFSREETGQQATEREGLATEETDHQALVLREKTVYDIGCIESAFT